VRERDVGRILGLKLPARTCEDGAFELNGGVISLSDMALFVWGFVVVFIALVGFASEVSLRPDSEGRQRSRSIVERVGPMNLIFLAAGISFALSVYLFFLASTEQGIFVGIWVPSIFSAGTLLHRRSP
jgi:hypothetical protein